MLKLKDLLINLGRRAMTLVLSFLLAFAAVSTSAFADELSLDFKFSASDIALTSKGAYTYVSIPDGSKIRDAVGSPSVPARFVNILLPDGATDVTVTATGSLVPLASDVTPWPIQHVAPKSKPMPAVVGPDAKAYSSSKPWPEAIATYEGLHEMQGSTFVSVRLNPIVYVGSEKALYYRPTVTVTVNYKPAASPKGGARNSRISEMVNSLVVNPSTTAAPSSNKRDANTVDYLIITSSSLSSAFQNLANYRATPIGGDFKTLVITKETISSAYTGDDIQMKIRNCIKDYVQNHGTTYVVLGGDDTIVPDRDCYAYNSGTEEKRMPTDLYYSDLTGTWKSSSSSDFGVTGANVDMSPDVIVGRIPVRTAAQLNGYLNKVRTFEADLTKSRNSIILGGPYAWDTYTGNNRPSDDVTGDGHAGFRASNHSTVSDSEMWLRRLYRDCIKPNWDNAEPASSRTINLACDYITSWDGSTCGDKPLSGSNLKSWLNNGYTHLMFSGHGAPQAWGMETSEDYTTTQAAAQSNLIAFVYTDACLTGAFDDDGYGSAGTITIDYGSWDQYTYTAEPCLGEGFIRNTNGGALAYMGCARYGWGEPDDGAASNESDGGPSTVYAYKFYKRLYEAAAVAANRTVGEAFAMSKADMISQCSSYGSERWIQFGLNYLGDPAIALYPRSSLISPKDLAITDVTQTSFKASWTAVEGAESYQVDVVKGSAFEATSGEIVLQSDFTSTTGWTLSGTGTYTGTGYYGQASPAIKFDTTNDYAISPVFSNGARLQFWALGNTGAGSTFKISGLVKGTWVVIETVSIAKGGNTYTVNLPAGTTQVRFDFTKNTYNCGLDDVVVYSAAAQAGEYVTGWQNKTVNGTSVNVTGLTPDTDYAVRVRAITSEETGGWSDVVTTRTVPADTAPVWSAFPEESSEMCAFETLELNIANYVFGIPTPTLSMVSSDSEEAEFDATTGVFNFAPTVTGTYHFTFKAANTEGSVETTLTVVVNEPPVTVPTLAVNEADVKTTTAYVSWAECTDVTAYTLQLATDDQFSAGNPGSVVSIVENGATSATAPSDWTYNIHADSKSYLVLKKGNYVITEEFDASHFADLTLSFSMRTFGGTAHPDVAISYSTDNGLTWTEYPDVCSAVNTNFKQFTVDISAVEGFTSVRLRISSTSTSSSVGVGVKNIVVSGTEMSSGSVIATIPVNGTEYTFTDLEPNTTYYARVKGEAEWSNIVSFTTHNALVVANKALNADAIGTAATAGGKYDVTLDSRTLYKNGTWNTICLPFDLTIAGSLLDGADVRALNSATYEGGLLTLNFTPEGTIEEIVAGTPYIIKWTSGSNITSPLFENVNISGTMNDFLSDDGKVMFKGTYDVMNFTETNESILFMGSDNKLYYPLSGASIGACRAYFQFTDGSPIKQFVLNFDGEDDPTSIRSAQFQPQDDSLWYDLEGRVLPGKPAGKGIYVNKGKKVVIK